MKCDSTGGVQMNRGERKNNNIVCIISAAVNRVKSKTLIECHHAKVYVCILNNFEQLFSCLAILCNVAFNMVNIYAV